MSTELRWEERATDRARVLPLCVRARSAYAYKPPPRARNIQPTVGTQQQQRPGPSEVSYTVHADFRADFPTVGDLPNPKQDEALGTPGPNPKPRMCRPGWQGSACERCVPFPGCLHGTCEKAWQCVCEQGWVGSQCDRDTRLCSSRPCPGNSTCVETGEGGFLCICPPGYTGKSCQLRNGPCLTNGSPCQNGGTCVDHNGSDVRPSCRCPPGFTGDFCEIETDTCEPNPCRNGATCRDHGRTYTCVCPPAFSGPVCNVSLVSCSDRTCANGGTCLNQTVGRTRCVCPPGLTGPWCDFHVVRFKPPSTGHHPKRYTLPAHAFDRLLRSPRRELLKVTVKETVHSSSPLITRSQIVCFAVLGLLTCLVVLGTTGIIFFNRCESWLANAKYSQLVRQQRDLLGAEGGERPINVILPEKIKLNKYGKQYTSI
ncbi:protein delta homolog 1 [Trichomycterus rosablanca]|uniref:protein delta homolog 1 n=1 Tax=Trichomycterus rosablanca TaxID=2290929 RepID=UPI002F34F3EB